VHAGPRRAFRPHARDHVGEAHRLADGFELPRLAQARANLGLTHAGLAAADHQAQADAIVAEADATVALEIAQARATEREVVETLAQTMLDRAVGSELAAR